MQIDVTDFFEKANARSYSASAAEIGQDAGRITWFNALNSEWNPLLKTEDERDAFRVWVKSSGGWDEEEIAAWSEQELNALFIQWVSGDVRECGFDTGETWDEVRVRQEAGNCSSNLYLQDGRVYFSLEN